MPRAYVCGTFDTKGPELGFIAACLRDAGVATCTVDVSTRAHGHACDVTAAEVARHHPLGEAAVLGLDDRGAAIAAMVIAFERFVGGRNDIAGIIGAGGAAAPHCWRRRCARCPWACRRSWSRPSPPGNVARLCRRK